MRPRPMCSTTSTALLQRQTALLDVRLSQSDRVRNERSISLSWCHPNRAQVKPPAYPCGKAARTALNF
jgi:hypothetical protein